MNIEDIQKMIANPFYAITIHEGLCIPHEPMITEEQWIKCQINFIKEVGDQKYFEILVDVLKGNYTTEEVI